MTTNPMPMLPTATATTGAKGTRLSGIVMPYPGHGTGGGVAPIEGAGGAFDEVYMPGCVAAQFRGEIGIRPGGVGGMGGVGVNYQHIDQFVLALSPESATFTDTPRGVMVSLTLPESVPYIAEMMQRGQWGLSATFIALEVTWEQQDSGIPLRQLRKILLLSAAIVDNAAYVDAVVDVAMAGRSFGKSRTVPGSRARGLAAIARMDSQSAREAAWIRLRAAQALGTSELRVGKAISAATAEKIRLAMQTLQALLGADNEPNSDDKPADTTGDD